MISRRATLTGLAAGIASAQGSVEGARPVRLVVLDMGGTLIEDRGDVPATLESAMSRHGVKSSREEIDRRRGASKREVIAYFVEKQFPAPGAEREKLIGTIHAEFTAKIIEIYRGVNPVAGAEEAIKALRGAGFLVATTTGFDRAIHESIVRRLGWEKLITASVCSDDVAEGRPAPYMIFHAMEAARVRSVAEVAVVGDTVLDLRAGNNAGAGLVAGVLTGAGKEADLRKEPRAKVVRSVADLPALLRPQA